MHAKGLTRRSSLLLPLLLAACGGEARQDFPPLRYNYLPPLGLNVATIDIEQRFIPSGISPDVTQFAPVRPADALRTMAEDRLKALGTAGRAVFAIQNASLVRHDDLITGTMEVILNVYPSPSGPRAGFAQARVTRQHEGNISDLPGTLYDMTKAMMDAMNVEFEYQLRARLREWLTTGAAVVSPVQQAPLDGAPPPALPQSAPDYPPPAAYPSSGYPSSGYPPPPTPLGGGISPR